MLKTLKKIDALFTIVVIIPCIIAVLYYGFIASDIYISESKFVVRSPDRQSSIGFGAFFRSVGFSRAQDDSYTIQEFINSRDALHMLNAEVRLMDIYSSNNVDPISRFTGIDKDNSFEALYRYYLKKIAIRTDSSTSISTLSVRSFTPESSQKSNQLLIEQSEALINRLNERGRHDLVKYATQEVVAAQKKATLATLALAQFRNTQNVIDPERQATIQIQQITKMQDESLALKAQISQLKLISPDNSQIKILQNKLTVINQEILAESNRVTGSQRSLSNKASEFQKLQLDADFANRQLLSALSSLESARNESIRQQSYIERISSPSLPDKAVEPRRLSGIFAVFIFSILLWGICYFVVSAAREHRE